MLAIRDLTVAVEGKEIVHYVNLAVKTGAAYEMLETIEEKGYEEYVKCLLQTRLRQETGEDQAEGP